jgi:hypothetical protein
MLDGPGVSTGRPTHPDQRVLPVHPNLPPRLITLQVPSADKL